MKTKLKQTENDGSVTLSLPEDLKGKLNLLAQDKGLRLAPYIRMILTEHVKDSIHMEREAI